MKRRITSRSTACLIFWAAGVGLVAWAGGWADGYLLRRGMDLPHPYPWRGVLTAGGVVSLVSLILFAVLRPESYRASWGRAASATALGGIGAVALGLGLLHAPPYLFALWLWLVGVTAISLGLFLASAGSRARRCLERLEVEIPASAVAQVVVPLPTTVLTHWRAPFTDGFKCELPVGLRLTALETAARGARACTFVPSDPAAFDAELVSPTVTSHPKYAGASIPLTAHEIRRHLELLAPGS